MDGLGLEQVDNRLGERIVVAVPDAAHGGLDPGLGETLDVADAHVLPSSVGVTDEAAASERARADRLPESTRHAAGHETSTWRLA